MQVHYEDKPVLTRFTHRTVMNHNLIKTIFVCPYTRGMPNSHEAVFVQGSAAVPLVSC